MKHLLKLSDLTTEELYSILDLADELKAERKAGIKKPYLQGKTLGMIFRKSSTRTRVSFEVGIHELGGKGLFLSSNDLQIGRGEETADTIRVLSRYLDGIMIRTFDQKEVEDMAEFGSIPIINGLTDYAHPCQVLADLQTIRELRGDLHGKKLCFIGDGNNMANSLIVGGLKTGMKVQIACPDGYHPDPMVMTFAAQYPDKFTLTDKPMEAAKDADVVITDCWTSMGQEEEKKAREAAFAGYQVNKELMGVAKADAMVLHCLPAYREQEITNEVFEEHADEIFDEAENRLHAQKAVLVKLLG